ncbi:tripartite tricarboxylate transporter substrate-binding protein [Micrococcus terreus]|uniref:tripartite tricarboxylate transporter substrate-binding protein n=1 Tax=Micrococcus terreus TaxID=574650 RepID=UPI0033F2CC28
MKRTTTIFSLGLTGLLALTACSSGPGSGGDDDGEWAPQGTVDLVVGAGPGGGSDIMARSFAKGFDGDIVVQNLEPVEGEFSVFSASGDPERIGVGNWASMIAHPSELDTGYKWNDFTQLGIVAADVLYLVAAPDTFDSAEDMVSEGQSRTLSVAQVGSSGGHQVVLEDMADALGIQVNPIGFDGAGDQMNAVISGDVDLAILSPGAFMPYVDSGDIEPILSSASEEYQPEGVGDVAVPADLGVDREFPVFWRNFFAPPGLTESEVEYWIEALKAWVESDSYDDYLETNYLSEEFLTGAELEDRMTQDSEYVERGSGQ